MKLTKGLKFIQDNSLYCEVKEIYTPSRIRGKKQHEMVVIEKNGIEFTYQLNCFQKSFNTGIAFGSFKIKRNEI